jgi:hypothetical protein
MAELPKDEHLVNLMTSLRGVFGVERAMIIIDFFEE